MIQDKLMWLRTHDYMGLNILGCCADILGTTQNPFFLSSFYVDPLSKIIATSVNTFQNDQMHADTVCKTK